MTGIIDYGVGNLFSLQSGFKAIGETVTVSGDAAVLSVCDRIVLPGVGAFRDAAAQLHETGLDTYVLREAAAGKPLLGICLGMQLLFDRSYEFGTWQGLGLIPGEIRAMKERVDSSLKIPQIGWNALHLSPDPGPLFAEIREGDHVYFVHSYSAVGCDAYLSAVTEYSCPITAAVRKDNIYGCQFHPEKSGKVGLKILRAFCGLNKGGETPC